MSDLQPDRCDDVTLFAVEIVDQGDVGRAIRIIFDLCNASRNTRFIAFEIDDPVMTLVASAAAPDRDPSVVVAA